MVKQILIIEDNKDSSILTEKILKHYNYETKVIGNSRDALTYCKTHTPPALILMDISLPVMDGIELTEQIKKMDPYKNTPVIAVTAYTDKETQEKALQNGFSGMLFKPFTPNELINTVQENAAENPK